MVCVVCAHGMRGESSDREKDWSAVGNQSGT